MNSATSFLDEMEDEYQVEYRQERTTSPTLNRSPHSRYLASARHSRRSSPQSHNGIHRRGRKNFT